MGVYYISACHDCKESITWPKYTKESCEVFHNDFHAGHKKEFGFDTDDEFYDRIWRYKSNYSKNGEWK